MRPQLNSTFAQQERIRFLPRRSLTRTVQQWKRDVTRQRAHRRFLRNGNGDTGIWLHGLENKAECLRASMQIVDHPRAVACLVRRRSGIDVFHSMTYGVVEQHRDLACRGSYRLGLADAGREPSIKGAERGVGASESDGSKAQKCRSPAAGPARS